MEKDGSEIGPSKQIEEILRCTVRIKDIFAEEPGAEGMYASGKAYMHAASACIEKSPGKALRLMRKAQEAIEYESQINVGLKKLKARRAAIPDYLPSKEETELEVQASELVQKENWKKALVLMAKLEEMTRARSDEAIESGTWLDIMESKLIVNRPTTINLIIVNGSAFPMKIVNMSGTPAKQVNIFNEFRKTIAPQGQLTVRMNVTGTTEGDMVVDVKADVETEGRRMSLSKQTSLKVEPQPVVVAKAVQGREESFVRQPRGDYPTNAPRTEQRVVHRTGSDPISMVLDASAQDWTDLLIFSLRNSIPLDMSGLNAIDYGYYKKGYRCFIQALLVLKYEPSMEWSKWLKQNNEESKKGIIGDEYSTTISRLLFDFCTNKEGKIEFKNDGGVEVSKKEKFTSALFIASGADRIVDNRSGTKSWDFKVNLASGDIDVCVKKSYIKDENGNNQKTVFHRVR